MEERVCAYFLQFVNFARLISALFAHNNDALSTVWKLVHANYRQPEWNNSCNTQCTQRVVGRLLRKCIRTYRLKTSSVRMYSIFRKIRVGPILTHHLRIISPPGGFDRICQVATKMCYVGKVMWQMMPPQSPPSPLHLFLSCETPLTRNKTDIGAGGMNSQRRNRILMRRSWQAATSRVFCTVTCMYFCVHVRLRVECTVSPLSCAVKRGTAAI